MVGYTLLCGAAGILRAQFIPPEYRGAPVTVTRVITLVLAMVVLGNVHHSPSLILLSCAAFAGVAAYSQSLIMHEEVPNYDDEVDEDLNVF